MNMFCMDCKGPFGELDTVICDGCERPSHREPCGEYELIERDGEMNAYFFCTSCLQYEEDEQ